jgi:hypothetical protein
VFHKEWVADDLLDHYLIWREECVALDEAYDRWSRATDEDRRRAFAAYATQLELEEQAARCYELSARSAAAALADEPLAATA